MDNECGRRDYGDRHGSCFDYLRPQFFRPWKRRLGHDDSCRSDRLIDDERAVQHAAFLVSGMAGAFTARLRRGLESGDATDEQLANYRRGLSTLGYVNAVLVVIAVGTMATARFA